MIKYRVCNSFVTPEIVKVEILKETEKMVVLPEKNYKGKNFKESKYSEYRCYFDTWEEAKVFLVQKAESNVKAAKGRLARAVADLEVIAAMKAEDFD